MLPAAEKERIVRDATVPGKITLCTRAFGRGVDFQVRDPTVAGKGGVHVVQTFMAETMAEETQIKGRTARQGETGSHSFVLCQEDLVSELGVDMGKFNGFDSAVKKLAYLHEKRDAKFAAAFAKCIEAADGAKAKHDISVKFLEALRTGDQRAVADKLAEWAE